MSRLLACRVCLTYDTRLCSIMDGQLRDIYEKLVEASLVMEDMLPTSVCFICFSFMKKMLQFRERSQKSNQILQQMISIGLEPSVSSLDMLAKSQIGTLWTLGMSAIETTTTTTDEIEPIEAPVKIESVKSEMDVDGTSDQHEDYSESMPVCRDSTSDSEDDLLVQNISEQCKPDQIKIVKTLKVILTRISVGHEGAAPPAKRKIVENEAENKMVNIQEPLRQTEKNEESREKKVDKKVSTKRSKSFETILKEDETTTSNIISGEQNDGAFNDIDTTAPPKDKFTCDLRKNESHMKKSHINGLNRKSSITPDLNVTNEFKSTCLSKLQEIQSNDKRKENNRSENKLRDNASQHKCQYCMKRFKYLWLLTRHLHVHTKEKSFKCDLCEKCFSLKSYLITHLRVHSKEKPFKCDTCGKSYSQKTHLNEHLRVHSREKPFKCDICGKGFSRKTYLNDHLRVHSKEKPFKCNICKKDFYRKNNLIRHINTNKNHTNEKPFKCDICEKTFSLRATLTAHLRGHTQEKPFKCDICGKGFSRRDTLIVHLRVHTKEKPFKCDICKKSFSHSSSLTKHLKVHT